MLFKKDRRKRGVGIHRIFLSLIMFSFLALGICQAYKSFSGIDPLSFSPKSTFNSLLSSNSTSNLLDNLMSFNPKQFLGIKTSPIPTSFTKPSSNPISPIITPAPTPKSIKLFTFAVVADSENDNDDLKKALLQAKNDGARFVIGAGDWTDTGTVNELSNAKTEFDTAGLSYYLIPGDHDLWDSRNRSLLALADYTQVFGQDYKSFDYDGDHFLLIDNADDYDGVSSTQMKFIQNDLSNSQNSKLIIVILSTPVYHPSSDHIMGDVEPSLKNQAKQLINLFKSYHVSEVIAGDTHFYSDYIEPTTGISMTAVGAITAFRNIEQPRYLMVDVYSDRSYNIQDTQVK